MEVSAKILKYLYENNEIDNYFCLDGYADKSINTTIRLAKTCNLLCSFCIQGSDFKKSYDEISHCNELTYKVIDKLNNELSQLSDKKIYIRLYGGEPFLFDVFGFLSKIEPGNNKVNVIIITNGTLFNKIRECTNILKKNLIIKFSISIHEDYVDVNKIITNIDSINKKYIHSINIVATGKNDEFIENFIKENSDKYKINIQPIKDAITQRVDEDVQKKYSDVTRKMVLNNKVEPRGYIKNLIPTLDMKGAICKSDTFVRYDHDLKEYLISPCAGEKAVPLQDAKILNENIVCKGTSNCTGCNVKYAFRLKK